MKDSEYIEMTRLLDSLTKGADTLRVVFEKVTVEDKDKAVRTGGEITTRDEASTKAKEHPLFKGRWGLLDQVEKEIGDLVGLINGCEDWTSNKFTASGIYRKMRKFVSSTSRMPVGISGLFQKVRSLCLVPMEIIPGRFPDLYHPLVRKLMADEFFQIAVDDGRISPPLTWNGRISDLANFIDENVDWQKPADYNMTEKKGNRKWEAFDCIFRKPNGEFITAKQLRDA